MVRNGTSHLGWNEAPRRALYQNEHGLTEASFVSAPGAAVVRDLRDRRRTQALEALARLYEQQAQDLETPELA
jgi:hypothetical protein